MVRSQNIKNLNTEKEGIVILRSLVDGFMVPDKDQRFLYYKYYDDKINDLEIFDNNVIKFIKYSHLLWGLWALNCYLNKILTSLSFFLPFVLSLVVSNDVSRILKNTK